MPYTNVPSENAVAPISHDFSDYTFTIDYWRATADDMFLFDTERTTSAAAMFEFLDRVVTDYKYRGESKGSGVTGKGVPLPILMQHLMPKIGEGMKELQNIKN